MILWDYAYLNNRDIYLNKIKFLAEELAEPEKWHSNSKKEFDILCNYIENTFSKCFEDNLLVTTPDGSKSAFNTGLLTPLGEEIYMMFTKNINPDRQEWYFYGFKKKSDNDMMSFDKKIEYPSFFKDYHDIFFDPSLEIIPNWAHIVQDNKDRLDAIMKDVPMYAYITTEGLISMLTGEIENTRKRVKRNQRMAVPMYYKGNVQFLLPIKLQDKIIPLVVSKYSNRYKGVTILEKSMAYKDARLIMKPETNWILP